MRVDEDDLDRRVVFCARRARAPCGPSAGAPRRRRWWCWGEGGGDGGKGVGPLGDDVEVGFERFQFFPPRRLFSTATWGVGVGVAVEEGGVGHHSGDYYGSHAGGCGSGCHAAPRNESERRSEGRWVAALLLERNAACVGRS